MKIKVSKNRYYPIPSDSGTTNGVEPIWDSEKKIYYNSNFIITLNRSYICEKCDNKFKEESPNGLCCECNFENREKEINKIL